MRLVLVDDDSVQLEKLKGVFKSVKAHELVGMYTEPLKAFDQLENDAPDLILTDILMPGMNGIELIKKVKSKVPGVDIIALTVVDEIDVVFSALRAGATGYLLKDISNEEFLSAVQELNIGGSPISPRIARLIITDFQEKEKVGENILTGRERDILLKLEFGLIYKEIADKLNLSHHTVRWHIKNIFKKLHANNKDGALKEARKKGLL
ncbi:MAG: response regulator transcription factor [Nitrospinae bacterium]|nr:response regulator transcription factor [Nitrospinota bacterium]